MNKLLLLLCCCTLLACTKDATPMEEVNEQINMDASKTYSGVFVDGPYGKVSGKAHIIQATDGKLQLQLEMLNSSNGPDLKVYLSKEIQPVNFIELGALKSVAGNQLYDIVGTPDFTSYKYALIHCKAFNHLFGSALLMKN
jgi:hypothetical protein